MHSTVLTYVAGAQKISVSDEPDNHKGSATFTVVPEVYLSSSAGKIGALIQVTGDGFPASTALTASLNGTALGWVGFTNGSAIAAFSSVGDPGPNFGQIQSVSKLGFQVPNVKNGTYILSVSGSSVIATIKFAVQPPSALQITDPASGSVITQGVTGQTVTVNALYFSPLVTVTLNFGTTTAGTMTSSASAWPPIRTRSRSLQLRELTRSQQATEPTLLQRTLPSLQHQLPQSQLASYREDRSTSSVQGSLTPNSSFVLTSTTQSNLNAPKLNLQLSPNSTLATYGTLANPTTSPSPGLMSTVVHGTYTLTVYDAFHTASVTLTVSPSITIVDAQLGGLSGVKGDQISINGGGFTAGTNETIWFGQTLSSLQVVNAIAGAGGVVTGNGNLAPENFVVPTWINPGLAYVKMVDGAGFSSTVNFTVYKPYISISPTSGAGGATIQISGGYFRGGDQCIIQVDGQPVVTIPTNGIFASGSDQFSGFFIVPSGLASGPHTITVRDNDNNTQIATFTATTTGGGGVGGVNTLKIAVSSTTNSGGQASKESTRPTPTNSTSQSKE